MRVTGTVQGVGLRPFVYALATRLQLAGEVRNDARGVLIEVEGSAPAVAEFVARVRREAPPLAEIDRIVVRPLPPRRCTGFIIVDSRRAGERQTRIAPDAATCDDCLRELFDPGDRRFRYPFINCTNCGPRFTIVRDVPYDRPFTTMAAFAMCAACAREYQDPRDRRFHAQPTCCPDCGPQLRLADADGVTHREEALRQAADVLRAGRVLAVKGLGGYHLAALASDQAAVAALRSRKRREERPFAVMARDLASAARLATITSVEAELLTGSRRPIVLLRRRSHAGLADAVAPGNRFVGIMLPYTPLYHLLCDAVGAPFVLTSGNVSDEPIAYEDADAVERLRDIADAFLIHDRPIRTRADDSVVRVVAGRPQPLRRARGWAPQPLRLPFAVARPILGCGAHLKNTFCLAKGREAFVSQHIGDLENLATLQAFRAGIEHYRRLFDIMPEVVAHDLHPEYLSSKFALELRGVERIGVQHHHAHLAACLAEHGLDGPAIGVAFDGLGYGDDGTLWGGEFFIVDLARYERVGWLEPVPMPGGTAAIRQPWRMAAAYLDALDGDIVTEQLAVRRRNEQRWNSVVALAHAGVHAPLTSGVGRLFDAVAAILDVRDEITYEGQAAIELEQRADPSERGAYDVGFGEALPYRIRGGDLIRAVLDDRGAGTTAEVVAARVHNTLARTVGDLCRALRARTGLSLVALSGGVFQNRLLAERTIIDLQREGFRVLTHQRLPANDGAISFGQVAVAAARARG